MNPVHWSGVAVKGSRSRSAFPERERTSPQKMEEVLLPTGLYFLTNTLNPSSLEAQCISAVRVQLVLLLLEVSACQCRKTLSCSSCPEASSCLWKTTSTISTRDQQVNRSMLHFLSFLTLTSSLLVAQPSSLEGANSDQTIVSLMAKKYVFTFYLNLNFLTFT